MNTPSSTYAMRTIIAIFAAIILAACASIGRPEGGERDETPPVYIKSNPLPGTVNFSRNKISVEFDENVQIKDPMTKVVVSPPQKTPPQVTAVGRRINVELRDTMLPNTTYTIDFSDAISDLNESNELDGFSFGFSTGSTIDTLAMSGMVFQASNLEPAQGMLVGVYSNPSDTAITTLPMERITKTNQYGQFTIRNLAPGSYRIYALDDKNRDYKWDRSEDIAFYDVLLTPQSEPIMVSDTLQSSTGTDSIVQRPATRFFPDDILLTWFNVDYKSQYLSKYERADRKRLLFQFGAPSDTFPEIRLVNGSDSVRGLEIKEWTRLNASPTRDTLEYWITSPKIMEMDTLMLESRFLRTDTTNQLVWGTDTLKVILKGAAKRKQEAKKEDKKEGKKESSSKLNIGRLLGKKNPKDTTAENDSVPKIEFAQLSISSSSTMDLDKPITLSSKVPIASFNQSGVRFEKQINDSTFEFLMPPEFIMTDSMRPMQMTATYKWEPGTTYKLTIDSLAVHDLYGLFNKPIEQKITTRKLEDYSTVTFNLKNVNNQPAVVQLLNAQDAPVANATVENSKATFRYILPGTYYARIFIDNNQNGKWDYGAVDSIQPEDVFYLPKKLNLKKNWDVAQEWDIYETPIDKQKPDAIKKNKPKVKKKDSDYDNEYDEDEEDYYDPEDPFGKRKGKGQGNRLRNNQNNGFNLPGGVAGGLRPVTTHR